MELFFWKTWENIFKPIKYALCVSFTIFAKKERMESLKQRRTIRKYQQKDISSDLLNDLLETACRASTVGNMQVYSVIVTRDADRKAKLAPAHFNQPMVQTAPVVLTFALICVVSANGVCSARRNRDIIILNGLSPGLLMLYWQRKHSVLQLRKKV